MARRSKGDGSVYKRKDGRWTGFIPLENGKRKYFYGKTKKEVLDQIRQALLEQQKGTLVVDTPEDYQAWLKERAELAGGGPSAPPAASPPPSAAPGG